MNIRTAILIDDQSFFIELHKGIIKQIVPKAKCTSFSDAREALDYLGDHKNEEPDLILLDLHMPLCSGFEFMDEIRNRGLARNAVLIVVSSTADEAEMDRALAHPACSAFSRKPLSISVLKDILSSRGSS